MIATQAPSATLQEKRPATAKIGPESAFGAALQNRGVLGVGGMLALQAAAGNRAVAGLVQAKRERSSTDDRARVHEAAKLGIAGASGALPHLERIQRSFGRHDVTGVVAHTGGQATAGAQAMGAAAFTMGNHVAFLGSADVRTAAHEAAHVVQQRAGVHLAGGVGAAGDRYERHADAVADRVVRGESAESLLDQHGGGGGSAARAVQRVVAPGLPANTKVTVIATGMPGILGTEHVGHGYDVLDDHALVQHRYADLNPRVAAPPIVLPVTQAASVAALGWVYNPFPHGGQLAGNKVIAQSPVARGDMHDVRAALLMDPQLKVLIGLPAHGVAVYQADVNTIVAYYQGIPNFATRIAVIAQNADVIRAATHGQTASASTVMIHAHRAGLLQANPGLGQHQFVDDLAEATTGPLDHDDRLDCIVDLVTRGFNRTSPYVLINVRDSGHNVAPGHAASHPEHDSGAQGFWDLARVVVEAGFIPVPMGVPGLAAWPGPSFLNYFNWPSTAANVRRNKRQAEYFLLRVFKQFNPHVAAIAWRSGVTDAITFAGIPVLALDVPNTAGHNRAQGRQQLLPGHYRQVNLSDRVQAGHVATGVAGWLGPLSDNDRTAVRAALGNGPRSAMYTQLGQDTAPPPLGVAPAAPEVGGFAVRRFITNVRQAANVLPPHVLLASLNALPAQDRQDLARTLPYAEIVAMWDLVQAARAYTATARGPGVPLTAPAATLERTTGIASLGTQVAQAQPTLGALLRPMAEIFADLDRLFIALAAAIENQVNPPAPPGNGIG